MNNIFNIVSSNKNNKCVYSHDTYISITNHGEMNVFEYIISSIKQLRNSDQIKNNKYMKQISFCYKDTIEHLLL